MSVNYDQVNSLMNAGSKLQQIVSNMSKSIPSTFSRQNSLTCELLNGIDHILDNIFSFLDSSSLQISRLVCNRWKYFATKQFQKSLEYRFEIYHLFKGYLTNSARSLINFMNVMQPNSLPLCNTFVFYGGNFNDRILQHFLTEHGHYIKDLSLRFDPNEYSERRSQITEEDILQHQITKLLVHQTPNLLVFSIFVKISESKQEQIQLEFNEEVVQHSINRNLQVVSLIGFTKNLINHVFKLAPNLREVALESKNLECMLKPESKLRLIKKLTLNPRTIEEVKKIYDSKACLTKNAGTKLRIREINISFCLYIRANVNCTQGSLMESRILRIINWIINENCNSLEKIIWHGTSFLDGILWPAAMPKVSCLYVTTQWSCDLHSQGIISKCFSIHKIFPNLKFIEFSFSLMHYIYFSNSLKWSKFTPVVSVKNVRLIIWTNITKSIEVQKPLKKLFPNAQFELLQV